MNSLIRGIRQSLVSGQRQDITRCLRRRDTGFLEIFKPKFEYLPLKPTGYQRMPIHEEQLFKLYYIKWGENIYSGIHGHPNKRCFFKTLEGTLQEDIYIRKFGNYYDKRHGIVHNRNSVGYIDDTVGFHNIINTGEKDAYSLHLYLNNDDISISN